ncbi:MAG: hypothetical protein V1933_00850 [Candidatus Omnitrophota bacterium]
MKSKIWKIVPAAALLVLILGCATDITELRGAAKLEAKDLLYAGDLAYKIKDYDNAQYFYELAVNKYPKTYYSNKAQENLNYVKYQRSLAGKAVQGFKDFTDPVF